MKLATTATLLAAALAATACGKKKRAKPQPPATTPTDAAAPPSTSVPPSIPPTPGMIEVRDVGFARPASVLWVPGEDVYLVANVNGDPAAADDNGFISKLAPDGVMTTLQWIDGARPEVTLNAPRGMAVMGGTLYVADLASVRMFDLATGAPKGAIDVGGASFLNDLAAGVDKVYASNIGQGGAATAAAMDAVYAIDGAGTTTVLASGAELAEPTGLAVIGGHVWVVPRAAKEMYRLHDGEKLDGTALPAGELTGLEALPDGRVVVASSEGRALYVGKPGTGFVTLADGVESPGDLGFDRKRNRIMVPLFAADAVRFYPVR